MLLQACRRKGGLFNAPPLGCHVASGDWGLLTWQPLPQMASLMSPPPQAAFLTHLHVPRQCDAAAGGVPARLLL